MANIERLKTLKYILDNHDELFPLTSFDMDRWSCGSAACALGSAAMFPEFVKMGLELTPHPVYRFLIPRYEGHRGYSAGAHFFNISDDDSRYLFEPVEYDIPAEEIRARRVSNRVQELIEKYS